MVALQPVPAGGYTHRDDPGEPGYSSHVSKRVSVSDAEAALLAAFARRRVVLEIGTGLGVATRAMAQGAAALTTLDPDPWVAEHVWPSLRELPNVGFMPRDMVRAAGYTLAFIDGNHLPASVEADLRLALNVIVPGRSLILMHDFNAPAVRETAERLCPGWRHIATEYGIGVVTV